MNIVYFWGGFANQLFELCMYEKLIEQYGKENVFADISFYKTCNDHGGFKLDKFFELNYCENIPENSIYVDENNYDEIEYLEEDNYLYQAYWQSDIFFPANMDFLKKKLSPEQLNSGNRRLFDIISNSQSVSVHVRRGDYNEHFLHGNIANEQYIKNAIDYIKSKVENPVFFIFSDDPDWCKNNIQSNGNECYYVTGNAKSVEQDLILMSCCKHNIIANSSFSWWGQELNRNEGKIVISPEYWFNEETTVNELNKDDFIHVRNVPTVHNVPNAPFFSILIPAYNKAKCIRRCLASVLNQSFGNIEIIIVDDGSTDDTYTILSEYAQSDARIKLFQNEKNSSLIVSRLKAMKNAKGKYILLLDSDDYLSTDTCNTLYDELKDNKTDVLEFSYIHEPTKKVVSDNTIYDKNYFEKLMEWRSPHTIWNKCYHTELIKKVVNNSASFYCNMSEDAYFSCVLFTYAKSFRRIDNVLYHYVVEGGISNINTLSKQSLNNMIDSILACRKETEGFLQRNNPDALKNYEEGKKREMRYLSEKIMRLDQRISEKIELLGIIDERFHTELTEAFEERLYNGWMKYEELMNGGRKHKLKILLKTIIKKDF